MGRMHINERGAHTTVIEGARDILKALRKIGADLACLEQSILHQAFSGGL